jgi:lipid-A-disaccharide synthase-like uncharacterized protein
MEAFLWTLALAVITGLTWIAYKHPAAFTKNIFPLLFYMPTMLVGGMTMFLLVAIDFDARTLLQKFAEPTSDNIIHLYAQTLAERVVFLSWLLIGYVAYAAFVQLLRYLPKILDSENSKSQKDDK